MKVSELINDLKTMLSDYGDLDVISKIDITSESSYLGSVKYVQLNDDKIVIGGDAILKECRIITDDPNEAAKTVINYDGTEISLEDALSLFEKPEEDNNFLQE